MKPTDTLDRTMAFLKTIGLKFEIEKGASGFVDGVVIRNGILYIDPCNFIPANVLHEAGHLACVPEQYRHLMNGNLIDGMAQIMDSTEGINPESPLSIAIMQMGDTEATAWAWAAGLHLGLNEPEIILDESYGDTGDVIRLALALRSYAGINGLARAGMCRPPSRLSNQNAACFPNMEKWVQPILSAEAL